MHDVNAMVMQHDPHHELAILGLGGCFCCSRARDIARLFCRRPHICTLHTHRATVSAPKYSFSWRLCSPALK